MPTAEREEDRDDARRGGSGSRSRQKSPWSQKTKSSHRCRARSRATWPPSVATSATTSANSPATTSSSELAGGDPAAVEPAHALGVDELAADPQPGEERARHARRGPCRGTPRGSRACRPRRSARRPCRRRAASRRPRWCRWPGRRPLGTPSSLEPLQAGRAAVAVGVHDELGAAASARRRTPSPCRRRSGRACSRPRAARRRRRRRRSAPAGTRGCRAAASQVLLVVVAADDDERVPAVERRCGCRARRRRRAAGRAPAEVLHRVGGERLELDGEAGPGLLHRRRDASRRSCTSPLADHVVAAVERVLVAGGACSPSATGAHHVGPDVVEQRDAGGDEDLAGRGSGSGR